LKCEENKGDIVEVDKQTESDTYFLTSISEKTNSKKNEFRRNFINYFSLGYEARVGFGILI